MTDFDPKWLDDENHVWTNDEMRAVLVARIVNQIYALPEEYLEELREQIKTSTIKEFRDQLVSLQENLALDIFGVLDGLYGPTYWPGIRLVNAKTGESLGDGWVSEFNEASAAYNERFDPHYTILDSTPEARLARARVSLDGLSVGDAFGVYHASRAIPLVKGAWHFTDDTNMACSIFSILRQRGQIDQDQLAESFAVQYRSDMGYGPAMHGYLARIRNGGDWRKEAPALFGGMGSFGNGSAMRVAPLGAYFADDLNKVVEQAELSAVVTHSAAEAVAGAIAVAVAAAVAFALRGGDAPTRAEFIDKVLPRIPDSEVRAKCILARDLAKSASVDLAVSALGNGSMVTCQDTVPFALWCAGEWLSDYEEALWLTASGGGDRDTTCAIVGGIVACYAGAESIPAEWLRRRDHLPNWALYDEEYKTRG